MGGCHGHAQRAKNAVAMRYTQACKSSLRFDGAEPVRLSVAVVAVDETEVLLRVNGDEAAFWSVMMMHFQLRCVRDERVHSFEVPMVPAVLQSQAAECLATAIGDRAPPLEHSSGIPVVRILQSDSHKALQRLGGHYDATAKEPACDELWLS